MASRYDTALYTPGHRACPGCGASIAARTIIEAAGPNTIVITATGCLETFTSPYGYSPWGIAWLHPLFENAAAVASGVAAALRKKKQNHAINVLVLAGDGGTLDIGLGSLSGMLERGDNVLYIVYDNEAYMNTGVQRSSATPFAATTMTTPAGKVAFGKEQRKKNLAAIALAHGIPYVATASIAFPKDLARKVKRALEIQGPKYLDVHCPCPIGWGFDPAYTIQVAKLAIQTGLVPLYETGYGLPLKARRIGKKRPVEEYLSLQSRFRHLFEREDGEHLAAIQALADENITRYGLVLETAKEVQS